MLQLIIGVVLGSVVVSGLLYVIKLKNSSSSSSEYEKNELWTENEKLKSEVTSHKERIASINHKYDELSDMYDAKQKECDALDKNVDELKNELEALKKGDTTLNKDDDVLDLKLQIRDLSRERNDLNEKLKNSQNSNVQSEDCQNKIIELETSIERLKNEKEILTEGKQTVEAALSFVQEVLKADTVQEDDYSKLYRNIDELYDFIENEVKLQQTDLVDENALSEWYETVKKPWIRDKKAIAFIGGFSSGKTSVINALLRHNNPNAAELPVGSEPKTAIPTYISYGRSNHPYRFFTQDNQLKELSKLSFSKMHKEILDELKGITNLIKYFVITTDNPKLKSFSILDTPGFSSGDKNDTQQTMDVINECDALFWLIPMGKGGLDSNSVKQLKNISRCFQNSNKPLYFIITKCDRSVTPQEISDVVKQIESTCRNEKISYQKILRFGGIDHNGDKQFLDKCINDLYSAFSEIQQTNCTSEYLNDFRSNFENLIKKYQEKENDIDKNRNRLKEDIDKITSRIDGELKIIKDKLYDLRGIINSHDYKAKFEGEVKILIKKKDPANKQFTETLENLCDENLFYQLDNSMNEKNEKTIKIGEASANLEEMKNDLKQLKHLKQTFEEKCENIKYYNK